jgi:hypothetical protein
MREDPRGAWCRRAAARRQRALTSVDLVPRFRGRHEHVAGIPLAYRNEMQGADVGTGMGAYGPFRAPRSLAIIAFDHGGP